MMPTARCSRRGRNVVIVEESELDCAYTAAGIPHRVTTAQYLISQGYCNPFLFKLAPWLSTPPHDAKPQPAATAKHPHAGAPVEGSGDPDEEQPASVKQPPARAGAERVGIRHGHITICR